MINTRRCPIKSLFLRFNEFAITLHNKALMNFSSNLGYHQDSIIAKTNYEIAINRYHGCN